MADVVANDTMPGAVTPEDRLALARSRVDANDLISAEKSLVGLKESEMQNLDLDAQASYARCSPSARRGAASHASPACARP
jgi:hypothetical protein